MGRQLARFVRGTLAFLLAGIFVITSIESATANEVHIVKPGETLSQIALRYGTTVANLRQLNELPDVDFVWYGQRLLIDAGDAAAEVAQNGEGFGRYVVRSGDSLTAVARRHGLSVTELARVNGITPLDWLYDGQVLRFPVSAAPVQDVVAAARVSHIGAVLPADAGNAGVVGAQQYTVRPGDTLARLARKHGIRMNRFSSAEWLYVGQVVQVPVGASPAPQPALRPGPSGSALQPAPPVAEMLPGRTRIAVHEVQTGELLAGIAERYGVNAAALARLNHLTNQNVLEVGQTLRIPSENALELIEGMNPRLDQSQYPTSTERWIEVDLSEQMAIAYEGTTPVKAFVISSGAGDSPTVTGTFRIWAKIAMQDMRGGSRAAGDYYHLRDVPNAQYFYENYGIHGTYWHSNFGTPMSRGCVNMTEEDAKWLFEWTSPSVYGDNWLFSSNANPGTLVMVHE